jgi:phosphate/sulfate permease
MLFAATYLGIPISTTHTVTGAVIGVGAARKVARCPLEHRRQYRHRRIVTLGKNREPGWLRKARRA